VSIAIIVIAVPEGLPLTVTLALAFSVMKMKSESNLVRRIDAVEKMGLVTEICVEKTGTLTENRMKVHSFYSQGEIWKSIPNKMDKDLLCQGILATSQARIEQGLLGLDFKGNRLDAELLRFATNNHYPIEYSLRDLIPKILFQIPFSSD